MRSILTKKVNDMTVMHNLTRAFNNISRKQYLNKLIKLSELCLTSGLKVNSYGKELSDLCLDIIS